MVSFMDMVNDKMQSEPKNKTALYPRDYTIIGVHTSEAT